MKKTTRLMLVSLVTLAMLLTLFPAAAGAQEAQGFRWPPHQPQLYKVTLTVEEGSGTVETDDGKTSYKSGDSVTIIATPDEGYEFIKWKNTSNSFDVSDLATFTFDMPRRDITRRAYFRLKTYEINVSADPTAGGTVSGGGTYNHGDSVTVVAEADVDRGYVFVNWTEGDNEVSTDATYTFEALADRDLVANFKRVWTLQVIADPPEGGTVIPEGIGEYSLDTIPPDPVLVTAQANPGYAFINWTYTSKITPVPRFLSSSPEIEYQKEQYAYHVVLTANFERLPVPGISITKEASKSSAYRGDEVTYTITVENTGEVDFYEVYLSDPMLGLNNVDIGPLYASGSEGETTFTESYTYTVPSDQPYGPMVNTASVEACGEGGYAAYSIVPNGNQYYDDDGLCASDEDSATVEIRKRPSRPGGGSSGSYSPDDYDWGPSEPTPPQPQPEPEPEPEEEVTEIIPEVPEAPPATPVEVTEEIPEEAPEEVVEEVTPELPKTGGNALLLLGLGSLLGGAGILFERRRARKR